MEAQSCLLWRVSTGVSHVFDQGAGGHTVTLGTVEIRALYLFFSSSSSFPSSFPPSLPFPSFFLRQSYVATLVLNLVVSQWWHWTFSPPVSTKGWNCNYILPRACACACVYIHDCVEAKIRIGCLPQSFIHFICLFIYFESGSLIEPGVAIWDRLPGQQVPGILLSLPVSVSSFYVGAGAPNSGLHACEASTLSTESSLQSQRSTYY